MAINQKYQIGILLAALFIVFIPVIGTEVLAMRHTGGTFMYPLDDTFIHMTIAKNLVYHHNWGINGTEFGSASSSILYTVILALFVWIFSASLYIPLVINCIAGAWIVFALQRWLQKENVKPVVQLAIFVAVAVLTPLPHLIVMGMEHTLQCLFAFLFIFGFSDWLNRMISSGKPQWKLSTAVAVYGVLTATIRYEGLFMVAIACLILLYHRKIKIAFLLGGVALLPIVIFGVYSVSKGSYFLPNSVLVKSESLQLSVSGIIHYVSNIVQKLTVAKEDISSQATQRLLIILPLTYLLFAKQLAMRPSYKNMLIILTGCTLLHLSLASTGWFYRYEAYLIFCAVVIIATLLYQYRHIVREKRWDLRLFILLLLFVLLLPVLFRSGAALSKTGRGIVNIYEQQYQMGRFLEKYYKNDMVAANDIGAVSFYTNGKILDLWGLGSIDVAKSRKKNYWTADFLDGLCKKTNTKIAIVYDIWFNADLLHRWKKVATWQISNNVICGDSIVSFYAIDEMAAPTLQQHLKEFEQQLPKTVAIQYY